MPRQPIEDLSVYKDKEATPAQEHFTDWIIDNVGVVFGTQKEMTAFREGVRLAKVLVMRHQASDENKEFAASQKAARASATKSTKSTKSTKAATVSEVPDSAEEASEASDAPEVVVKKATRGRRGRAAQTTDAPF